MSDFTPEHNKRASDSALHAEVEEANAYVDSVAHTADKHPFLWYGWALREAFLAGISYAKREQS